MPRRDIGMSDLNQFMREQIATIQAMERLHKSLIGNLDLMRPKILLPDFVVRPPGIQSALLDVLEHHRATKATLDSLGLLSSVQPAFRATESIVALLGKSRPLVDQFIGLQVPQQKWKELLGPSIKPFDLSALETHLAGVAKIAETSKLLTRILPPDRIGLAFSLSPTLKSGLWSRFEEMTSAYGDFYDEVGESDEKVLALPPAATARPAAEYFNEVDLLEATTSEEVEREAREEIEAVRAQIAAETADALSATMTGRFPDLMQLIQGAQAAFKSKYPDYERHFITSLRELFNHVLHRLAPDDEVRKFSTDAKDFPANRPTRNVRLRYICRGVNSGRFAKFVEKDVAAALAFVDILNGGTHEVACSYTEPQCRALMARAEGLVRFLLEIAAVE